MARISLKVNGKTQVVDVDPETPLLYVLRNDLQLNGPKFGCGLAQCGACTVIMNGNAIRSCVTQVSSRTESAGDHAGRSGVDQKDAQDPAGFRR